jgi:MFS family permease
MSGDQFNFALCIFFVPYIILEVPANMIMKKFKRPSWWIAILATAWGLVMTLTGIVKSYEGLVAARFFLGLAEAGFFPGAILIVSQWYAPNEVGVRIALFYTSSALAGAFSGLLAFAIAKMHGMAGLEGWRWIFLIEGLVSVAVGVACPWILIDSPELSNWLDEDEKRFLKLRKLAQERTSVVHVRDEAGEIVVPKQTKITWPVLKSVLTDWKIYLQAVIAMSNTIPAYSLKFTMPQIIKNMGFTSSNAQLLTIPPYAVGAISAYVSARFADKFKWRMPFIVVPQLCVLTAFSICFAYAAAIEKHIPQTYFGVVLACLGLYPIIPGANAWNSNNLAGPMRRAAGIGFMMAMANGGGLVGSFIYIKEEAPRYPTGFGTSLAINNRKSKMTIEEIRAKYTEQELMDMGDKSPLFKYTL